MSKSSSAHKSTKLENSAFTVITASDMEIPSFMIKCYIRNNADKYNRPFFGKDMEFNKAPAMLRGFSKRIKGSEVLKTARKRRRGRKRRRRRHRRRLTFYPWTVITVRTVLSRVYGPDIDSVWKD